MRRFTHLISNVVFFLVLASCDPYFGTADTYYTYCMFYVINDTERNLNVRWLHYNTAVTDEEYVIEPSDTLCIHDMFIYSSKESELYNRDRTNEAIFKAFITLENRDKSCFEVLEGDDILVKWQKDNPDNNLFFSINAWDYKESTTPDKKERNMIKCWYFHITEDMLTNG